MRRKRIRRLPIESVELQELNAEVPESEFEIPLELIQSVETARQIYEWQGGTSSLYKPRTHPMLVLQHFAEGGSEAGLVVKLGVSLKTVKKWRVQFPDFETAYDIGLDLQKNYWDRLGVDNLENPRFNTALYNSLRQGLDKSWGQKDSGPVNIDKAVINNINLQKLSLDELEHLSRTIAKISTTES